MPRVPVSNPNPTQGVGGTEGGRRAVNRAFEAAERAGRQVGAAIEQSGAAIERLAESVRSEQRAKGVLDAKTEVQKRALDIQRKFQEEPGDPATLPDRMQAELDTAFAFVAGIPDAEARDEVSRFAFARGNALTSSAVAASGKLLAEERARGFDEFVSVSIKSAREVPEQTLALAASIRLAADELGGFTQDQRDRIGDAGVAALAADQADQIADRVDLGLMTPEEAREELAEPFFKDNLSVENSEIADDKVNAAEKKRQVRIAQRSFQNLYLAVDDSSRPVADIERDARSLARQFPDAVSEIQVRDVIQYARRIDTAARTQAHFHDLVARGMQGDILAMSDPNYGKAVDQVFNDYTKQIFQMVPFEAALSITIKQADALGRTPTGLKAILGNALDHGSPEKRLSAAAAASTMKNRGIETGLSDEQLVKAGLINAFADSNPETAAENADKVVNVSDAEKKVRRNRYQEIVRQGGGNTNSEWLRKNFEQLPGFRGLTIGPFGDRPAIPPALEAQFETLVAGLHELDPNIDRNRETGLAVISRSWGVTNIGKPRVMAQPPELFHGGPNEVLATSEWAGLDLVRDVREMDVGVAATASANPSGAATEAGSPFTSILTEGERALSDEELMERLVLESDFITMQSPPDQKTWPIVIIGDDGVPRVLPRRWAPDAKKSRTLHDERRNLKESAKAAARRRKAMRGFIDDFALAFDDLVETRNEFTEVSGRDTLDYYAKVLQLEQIERAFAKPEQEEIDLVTTEEFIAAADRSAAYLDATLKDFFGIRPKGTKVAEVNP